MKRIVICFILIIMVSCASNPKKQVSDEITLEPYQENIYANNIEYNFVNFTQAHYNSTKYLVIELSILSDNCYVDRLSEYDIILLDERFNEYRASGEDFSNNLVLKEIDCKARINGTLFFQVPDYVENASLMLFIGMAEKDGVMGAYRSYFFMNLPEFKHDSVEAQKVEVSENVEECPPRFSYEFTDFSKIDAFQPIGSITGASRGRSYIIIKEGESVPVYAPIDATLISVIYAYRGPDADHGEYGFLFDTECGVSFLLDHLDSASEEMQKYAPAEPSRSTATNDRISVPVKAGTLLGYTDGTPQAGTFDFLVLDSTKTDTYINPDRWKWEQSLYSVCPYDLYEETLREKYYAKIGTVIAGKFRKAENCGKTVYDIENTISGGWFLDESSTDMEGEYLLIGQQMGVVDLVVKTDREGVKLRITDYDPLELPEDISIGESVCYHGFNNDWVYVHLMDSDTIEITNGRDDCPSSFPTTGATTYYR